MENFSELIKNRRSMRKFTDEELTQDEVVALMKAALMSPSSKRSNSWQFIVVDDKEILKELSNCTEQASSFIADAALAIVVMADPLASDVWIEDAAIASIMIQLQAEDLGLGSCWVQVRERFTATGMPSDEFVHGILAVSYTHLVILPSLSALILFSIFMASNIMMVCPFFTASPTLTLISRITPGSGDLTPDFPEAGAAGFTT